MDGSPFLVSVRVNGTVYAKTLVDTGCLSYGTISSAFVRKHCLPRIQIRPRSLVGVNYEVNGSIREVTYIDSDLDGHRQKRIFLYIVPDQKSYDLILGLPWMAAEDVVLSPRRAKLTIRSSGIQIWSDTFRDRREPTIDCVQVMASVFAGYVRRSRKQPALQVFKVSMADIEKALKPKTPKEFQTKLPEAYREFVRLFDPQEADKLPPSRKNVDHEIHLEKDQDGREAEPPYGPLYNMSREELLVLRRTLTELLDKNFIRTSQSPAASPVLFVRKPGGGLRFCVDYRALNAITRKDRYPLPLFNETLRAICRAKWFTKLDVTAAFHKIRVKEGDEWKTAFRTRYGLYEWLVTPFGLTGAPGTFQRYINWTLREYLDEFVSAYIDDVLIFSDGTLQDHRRKVKKVLARLQEAGLHLDIDKCEFEQQTVKYLGFIITAGEGIRMDPEKVAAILQWEAPKTVKAVRAFLGFANYYRRFIQGFSDIVRPLTQLTRKGASFIWTDEVDQAFEKLKELFISAPVLAQFNPDAETIVECDSSGWAIGGILSQRDQEDTHPTAYFSKKNTPAECNYDIGDKEMLAIVRCLEEWSAELKSVRCFTIITDHENLKGFMQKRRLTERQIRWAQFLADFDFHLVFRPGRLAEAPDALSRREQDMPNRATDERLTGRDLRIFDPETGQLDPLLRSPALQATPAEVTDEGELPILPIHDKGLITLWKEALDEDRSYDQIKRTILEEGVSFPKTLNLKLSPAECQIRNETLYYRDRIWVPEWEPLRTQILQTTHDSVIGGHPGRHSMLALLSRSFFWPNISQDVRRFARNCDTCGRIKAWREKRRGLLKPLPIPERVWRDITMDFITDLPPSRRTKATSCMVITDRLSKGKIFEAMTSITAEAVADKVIQCFVRHHGFPGSIVSDRGTQFVGRFWKRLCEKLKIIRRLSTSYHPETDGATERANQDLETYLRAYTSYAQDDWEELLPIAELSANNRISTATGVSPFFLTHGYDVPIIEVEDDLGMYEERKSPIGRADALITKLNQAQEWCSAAIATAQQRYIENTDRHRQTGPALRVNDYVWLNLQNVRTSRICKKLDWKNAKFRVIEKIGSHAYRLNTPPGIHNVFNISLLKPASADPWPSQAQPVYEPPAILNDEGEEEFEVESIVRARTTRGKRQVLVKWTGYDQPTWEPLEALKNTEALQRFEHTYESAKQNDGPQHRHGRKRRRRVL